MGNALNPLPKRLCSRAVFRAHLEMNSARHLEIPCCFVLPAASAPRDAHAVCVSRPINGAVARDLRLLDRAALAPVVPFIEQGVKRGGVSASAVLR